MNVTVYLQQQILILGAKFHESQNAVQLNSYIYLIHSHSKNRLNAVAVLYCELISEHIAITFNSQQSQSQLNDKQIRTF